MKKYYLNILFIILGLFLCVQKLTAQSLENPLEKLSYYIGVWGPPNNDPMIKRDPKMINLKVIDFQWGAFKRVILSRTGLFSNDTNQVFSEGIITYNPNTKKIVWLEYQIENEILFEGEYIVLEENKIQRVYTVYYAEDYPSIPLPELPGWTRKFRETLTPTSNNNIDWLTEVWVNGKWIRHGRKGVDFKAERR